jgi:hypothetical protein
MKKLITAAVISTALFSACTNHQDELHNKMIALVAIQDNKQVDGDLVSNEELKNGYKFFNETMDTCFVVLSSKNIVKK